MSERNHRKIDDYPSEARSSRDRHKKSKDKDKERRRRSSSEEYYKKKKHKSSEHHKKEKHSRKRSRDKYKKRHRSKTPDKKDRQLSSSSASAARVSVPKTEIKPPPAETISTDATVKPIQPSNSSTSVADIKNADLPAYYNPSAVNAAKLAEQQKKRKLLWSAKKDEPVKSWTNTQFAQDSDGTKASKFMRLMGIKDAPPKPEAEPPQKSDFNNMFTNMEHQYEVARQITHLARGQGFGFYTEK